VEILLQRLYLDIEAVRFPERLVIDIDVPEMLRSACVPGLILQPLVENAVKYGVSRARRPVTIRIRASAEAGNLLLSVEDDGDATNSEGGGTGVGLRNVRDRLATRFGNTAHCHWGSRAGGGFAVRMTMPLVHNGC
jgi:sensor histidine kinase YesM